MKDKRAYILVADFNVHDICKKYKNDMMNVFNTFNHQTPGYNTIYDNQSFYNEVIPLLKRTIHAAFDVDENIDDLVPHIYVQDKNNYESYFHYHVHVSTISCTFYIDPPKHGGEFAFVSRFENNEPNIKYLKPEKNKLYMFPGWLYHRPMPQQDDTPRICVNVDYNCRKRPLLKQLNLLW